MFHLRIWFTFTHKEQNNVERRMNSSRVLRRVTLSMLKTFRRNSSWQNVGNMDEVTRYKTPEEFILAIRRENLKSYIMLGCVT
jgi:hypothetical protein